jgi:hypothetical protein
MPTRFATESRRGQSAVETMMLTFGIAVVLVAMFHLFTVTWASGQAHIRARESLFHSTAYLEAPRSEYTSVSSSPFDPDARQYNKAMPDEPISFSAEAWDTTRDDLIGSQSIDVLIQMTE